MLYAGFARFRGQAPRSRERGPERSPGAGRRPPALLRERLASTRRPPGLSKSRAGTPHTVVLHVTADREREKSHIVRRSYVPSKHRLRLGHEVRHDDDLEPRTSKSLLNLTRCKSVALGEEKKDDGETCRSPSRVLGPTSFQGWRSMGDEALSDKTPLNMGSRPLLGGTFIHSFISRLECVLANACGRAPQQRSLLSAPHLHYGVRGSRKPPRGYTWKEKHPW